MQRFLFLLESFEWLHRWHGHVEARRVADRSVLGILLREGEREIGPVAAGSACKIEEKIIQFLFVETIFIYIRDLQYHSEIPPPNIEWQESQGDTQLSVRGPFDLAVLLWNRLFWFKFFPCSGMTPKVRTVQGERVLLKLYNTRHKNEVAGNGYLRFEPVRCTVSHQRQPSNGRVEGVGFNKSSSSDD